MEDKKKSSKVKKFYILLIMLIILLIPIAYLNSIVNNRQDYKNEAVNFIQKSWGGMQRINAPAIYYSIQNKDQTENKYLELNNYNVNVKLDTQYRKKGIFKIPVYTADVNLSGDFTNNLNLKNKELTFEFTISDSKGFTEQPKVKILSDNFKTAPKNKFNIKIHNQKSIPFEIQYKIRGTNKIFAEPKGMENKISIEGNWADPSFEGDFLPVEKKITKENFRAEWKIPFIATSSVMNPEAGVSLLVPVDNYKMSVRTTKYAFLFLSLMFLSFFIFEISSSNKKPVHQLQYLIMGGAGLVYYLLLVSMSEFMPFLVSYIIACLMTTGLIGLYTYFVIVKKEDTKFPLIISVILTLLYIFLYVLLALTDYSLLTGSIGLFIITAIVMYTTRKIEWYND